MVKQIANKYFPVILMTSFPVIYWLFEMTYWLTASTTITPATQQHHSQSLKARW